MFSEPPAPLVGQIAIEGDRVKVRMLVQLTGYHPDADGNSVAYPPAGDEIVVDDRQGAHLCDAGYAVPVVEKERNVEKRGPGRPRKTERE